MPNIDIRLVGASNLRRTEVREHATCTTARPPVGAAHCTCADSRLSLQRLGRQDPYAVCQLGQQHFRTHVAKDCDTQANWQTVGQFTGVKPQDVFTITVYNRNRVSADEEIGALRLSVQDFMHVRDAASCSADRSSSAAGLATPPWLHIGTASPMLTLGNPAGPACRPTVPAHVQPWTAERTNPFASAHEQRRRAKPACRRVWSRVPAAIWCCPASHGS